MTKYVDYSSRISADLRQRAMAAGILDEAGDISRQYCTCGSKHIWGWMRHAGDCPVYGYHCLGGLDASDILEAILEEEEKGD